MSIYDYYVKKNVDKDYVDKFQSTADKDYGKTFQYINTNYRSILTFIDTFSKNKIDKQHTVRMEQSKLFRKENGNYTLTAKGKTFKKFVDNKTFTKDEQWVLVYYFLLNSYFDFQKNYIIKKSKSIYSEILKVIKYQSYIDDIFKNLFKNSINIIKDKNGKKYNNKTQFENLIKYDAFWILSFYKDEIFLLLYYSTIEIDKYKAKAKEKDKLINYIIHKKNINDLNDLLVKKYKPKGQYTVNTFIDDVKVLYITNELLKKDNTDYLNVAKNIINIYKKIIDSNVSENKILDFIKKHSKVFKVIFNEVFLNRYILSDIGKKKIDNTTTKNKKYYEYNLRNVSMESRNNVKKNANYKCVLEDINKQCNTFNTKEDNPYLEIHHLIPFAVSNSFENSLDIEENLVALCPRCHRLLHFAKDSERFESLKKLYEILEKNNKFSVSEDDFLKMYSVEEDK